MIKSFLKNVLLPQTCEPSFVTTQGISYYLDNMFKEAQEWILIVSPYIKINPRLWEILQERHKAGVIITVVYRKEFLDTSLASHVYCRNNLHAKCYVTESAALMGSMNLYDFSQVNNDEMGFYVHKNSCPSMYEKIQQEALRLCKNYPEKEQLEEKRSAPVPVKESLKFHIGQTYSLDKIKEKFLFCDDVPAGIKPTIDGNVVLFWHTKSNKYTNIEKNGILYYQGQNTGQGPQQLIFGNKALHDCYTSAIGNIFLFKDGVFCGEQIICEPPFQKGNVWYFPLQKK